MDCVHHWIIDSPDGSRYLRGVCRRCGAERTDFEAGEQDLEIDWDERWNVQKLYEPVPDGFIIGVLPLKEAARLAG